ncbi:RNA polymerase sigma-70 factor, ECF subfamily [Rhodobacter sp. 24-YEA-8]|nr:RNA polymerase sigma-70 factor, ECF subfamily [Rhodobacter sp. 24-YEA-8]
MTPPNDPASGRTAGSGATQDKVVKDRTAKDQSPPAQAVSDPREQLAALLPNLRAFAISLSRNVVLADDIVQETILKAWSNMDKFDPATNLEAWLFTILRNTYYSFLRKTRREVQDSDGVFAGSLSEAPAHDSRLAYGDFQRAFDQLSPEHREVLILIGASGYSVEEAAQMMGVAPGTVKSRASRARKRLSELMGLAEGEDLFSGFSSVTAAVISRPTTPAT